MLEVHPTFADRARGIRLLLLDVDGVLTDGRFLVAANGDEWKSFHSRDGLGIRLAIAAGLQVGVISGRRSPAVERRARELGLAEVHLGVDDKLAVLLDVLRRHQIELSETGFFGDDLVDLKVMRRVGLAVTVPEADEVVRAHSHLVTERPGGHGAVRELIQGILEAQGRWQDLVAGFL